MSPKDDNEKLQQLIENADEIFSIYSVRMKSKSIYQKALKIAEKENKTLELEYIQGKIDLLDENWESALNHFDTVLELNPSYENALIYKGIALRNLGRHEEALECYDTALKINPENEISWNNKGIALGNLGRHEEALECYDTTLRINPDYINAWNNKGIALGNLGRHEEALECYDTALKINPENEISWNNKGIALGNLGRHEEALECYDTALRINPDYINAWNNKGIALGDLGRHEEALECYDTILKINPEFKDALNNKGIALGNLGKYEEAIECFNDIIKRNPKDEDALNNKGLALGNLGKYEEALECYDTALKINPNYINALNNKGMALGNLGRHEEAIEYFNATLRINPEFETARKNKNLALIYLNKLREAEKEREKIYENRKNKISKSELSPEEKEAEILETDAWNEVLIELKDNIKNILDEKKKYEDKIAEILKPRDIPLDTNFFSVLRRWNSYTPRLHTATEENVGGGYFLCWNKKGIVIDPGFDFIDNFFNNGFLIYDIDAVMMTHAHVDHCNDFESILTLLFEYNEKIDKKKKKSIDIFMNMGSMKKYLSWLSLKENEPIRRIYPLQEGISYNLEGFNCKLKVTKALHDEVISKDYSVGLIFELYDNEQYTVENPFRIGYMSDTGHDENIENQYKGVDILIPHIGSIDESDLKFEEKRKGNHLMLRGTISSIFKSNAKLAIVSEFGEELGEHRMTIIGALNDVFQSSNMARCLTGDIGLNVSIPDMKVKCKYCKNYFDMDEIAEGLDPTNKTKKCIIYYCNNCKNIYEHEKNKYEDNKSSS